MLIDGSRVPVERGSFGASARLRCSNFLLVFPEFPLRHHSNKTGPASTRSVMAHCSSLWAANQEICVEKDAFGGFPLPRIGPHTTGQVVKSVLSSHPIRKGQAAKSVLLSFYDPLTQKGTSSKECPFILLSPTTKGQVAYPFIPQLYITHPPPRPPVSRQLLVPLSS